MAKPEQIYGVQQARHRRIDGKDAQRANISVKMNDQHQSFVQLVNHCRLVLD